MQHASELEVAVLFLTAATTEALGMAQRWNAIEHLVEGADETVEMRRLKDEWEQFEPLITTTCTDASAWLAGLQQLIEAGEPFEHMVRWARNSHEVIVGAYRVWIEVETCLQALESAVA